MVTVPKSAESRHPDMCATFCASLQVPYSCGLIKYRRERGGRLPNAQLSRSFAPIVYDATLVSTVLRQTLSSS